MHPSADVLDVRSARAVWRRRGCRHPREPLTDDEWAEIQRLAGALRLAITHSLSACCDGSRRAGVHIYCRGDEHVSSQRRRRRNRRAAAVAALLVSRLQSPDDPVGIGAFRREVLHNRMRSAALDRSLDQGTATFGDGA